MILGIDPGVHGAIAFLTDEGLVGVFDMPIVETLLKAKTAKGKRKTRRKVDVYALARIIDDLTTGMGAVRAVVEQVGARPTDSGMSAFAFGEAYGCVLGVLAGLFINAQSVTPQKWKKVFNLSSDKDLSRERATALFPNDAEKWRLKKHDGRAEAVLLAVYGTL